MRKNQPGQGVGDLGILVVDLGADAGRQERDPFQQPLDVRILAGSRRELKSGGDVRVFFPELPPHVAQEAELALVIVLELLAHPDPPWTSNLRVSIAISVSKVTGSRSGSMLSRALIWNRRT